MNFSKHNFIVEVLLKQFGDNLILENADEEKQPYIEIPLYQIQKVCSFLKTNSNLYFDFLNSITGIDNGPETGTMEVWYHLTSIALEHSFIIKITLDRAGTDKNIPAIASVTSVWKTADWHERETYDLLGIHFDGHPDLRRILLPADWQGYPLRKDYVDPEKYHGVNIKYDR